MQALPASSTPYVPGDPGSVAVLHLAGPPPRAPPGGHHLLLAPPHVLLHPSPIRHHAATKSLLLPLALLRHGHPDPDGGHLHLHMLPLVLCGPVGGDRVPCGGGPGAGPVDLPVEEGEEPPQAAGGKGGHWGPVGLPGAVTVRETTLE